MKIEKGWEWMFVLSVTMMVTVFTLSLVTLVSADNVTVHVIRTTNTTYMWTGTFAPISCDNVCVMEIPERNSTTLPSVVANNLTAMRQVIASMNKSIADFKNTSMALLTSSQAGSLLDTYRTAILSDLSQRFADQQASLTFCNLNITRMNRQDIEIINLTNDVKNANTNYGTAQSGLVDCTNVNNNYFWVLIFLVIVIFVLVLDHYGSIPNLRRSARI
jgi:hypothetical protein